MDSKNECYIFKKYTYTDGILNSLDASYIIHLEGNGRLPDIEKQLSQYHPSNIVYLVLNKGYKKCKKDLKVQNSIYDLIDTNLEILKHSKSNMYSNILILEDDFIFNESMKQTDTKDNINNFIHTHNNNRFIYHLGALPFIITPYNLYTYYTFVCFATHATIFSKSAQEFILEYSSYRQIDDWDFFLIHNISRYIYYKPLCYQTIPETENKANWNQIEIVRYFANLFISLTHLDTQPEPGTTIVYLIAKILSLLLFVIIIFIIYFILSYMKIFKFISKYTKRYLLKR